MYTEYSTAEFPIDDGMTWIKHTTTVFVEIRLPLWKTHVYTSWYFRDAVGDEFGPVRGFDIPFDLIGDWDSSAIPPIDGELTSAKVSLA